MLINNATGAVQKNITANDVLQLPLIEIYDGDINLNKYYLQTHSLKDNLVKIKSKLIQLLIK